MPEFTNRLGKESSPYLLQHAHNPVDWYPWGEEAIEKAKREDRPILISIGYSACHWCHVMERESFENGATAKIMNENFVNIKIDREERPDLDHIYMDAVQAMTGSGGWPLNVFLTPDLKPFYGGTYFPPQRAFNRSSWKEILLSLSKIYQEKRDEINSQAEELTQHILSSNQFGQADVHSISERLYSRETGNKIFETMMKSADPVHGGFGKAPKFPQTFNIQYLLHYYYHTKNEDALDQACISLNKMIQGGIYDQIGGGFSRYSTDNEWLVPHFEKMLYDNALLIIVLSEAYQVTQKKAYKDTIEQTIAFIEREMMSVEGGFYTALDADSEGVEGKFYVWSKNEIEQGLMDDALLFCEFYGITDGGNWEHTNILNVPIVLPAFAATKKLSVEEVSSRIRKASEKLLEQRGIRVRPSLDDKILLGWNALMNTAYSKAYAAFNDENFKDRAIANMQFLLSRFKTPTGKHFYHSYKNQEARHPAFLDDYAYLIQALIHLQEITGNMDHLRQARALCEYVIEHYEEKDTGFFFFTNKDQKDVLVRKKELYDGAVPSGNSIMAWNLYYLGVVFDLPVWKERALKACSSMYDVVTKYPTSFGVWATNILGISYGIPEVALTGEHIQNLRNEFLRTFIPFRIFQSSTLETKDFPLLAGKKISEQPLLFLCKDYTCQQPVTEMNVLNRMLEHV
ncbi:MAG: thioredoxin domain-containing protein [Chitinophagaceae bacterium]|nr:thioredoxin domain-containing protein [Chitinophagaceae bacterium]